MVTENNESVLRKTQLFAKLTAVEMQTLCMHVARRHLARGEVLFGEGDQCKGLFVVATGTIRIFKLSATGREQVLAVEGPGSSFAELPVFDGGVYPSTRPRSGSLSTAMRFCACPASRPGQMQTSLSRYAEGYRSTTGWRTSGRADSLRSK